MSRQQAAQGVASALGSLRDIGGVHGSFVVSQAGEVIGKDLPAVFDDQVFAEVGPRIVRFRETFASVGDEVDSCLLKFAEHKLFLRSMDQSTVGVLIALTANMPALKMAVSLAMRRMAADVSLYHRSPPELPARASSPPEPPAPPVPQPSAAPAVPAARPRAKVMFRGHQVK